MGQYIKECKVKPSEEINFRHDFPLLCNARQVRTAIEVGTDQGVFAEQFMQRFDGGWLFCIDDYRPYEWNSVGDVRLPDLLMATEKLAPWAGRVRIVLASSPAITKGLPEWVYELIDFVYIDGSHDYESAKADIEAWWDLLPSNGLLAGHDYDETHPGVMRAVEEFGRKVNRVVRYTAGDPEPSWYIYKDEPAKIHYRFFQGGSDKNPERKDLK